MQNILENISKLLPKSFSDLSRVFSNIPTGIYISFAVVSFFAASITIWDKTLAVTGNKSRISESFLFLVAFVGGSVSMLVSMIAIRHKTKHKRFMIGLPLIILLQLVALYSITVLF